RADPLRPRRGGRARGPEPVHGHGHAGGAPRLPPPVPVARDRAPTPGRRGHRRERGVVRGHQPGTPAGDAAPHRTSRTRSRVRSRGGAPRASGSSSTSRRRSNGPSTTCAATSAAVSFPTGLCPVVLATGLYGREGRGEPPCVRTPWDGQDDNGRPMPRGARIVRLSAAEQVITRR